MNQFPKTIRDYTAYKDKRCALPFLADTYGLYYNKKLLAKAGISEPPKTVDELAADAKKLTTRNNDGSLDVVGFDPLMGFYENAPVHNGPMWGAKWMDGDKSALAEDPAWEDFARWTKKLGDWYGYDKLVKWQAGAGDEFSASNAFERGKLAMMLDGEYRIGFIKAEHPELDFGTAPLPVSKPDLYGSGFVIGTIMGLPKGAKHTDPAWLLPQVLLDGRDDAGPDVERLAEHPVNARFSEVHEPQVRPEVQDLHERLREPEVEHPARALDRRPEPDPLRVVPGEVAGGAREGRRSP